MNENHQNRIHLPVRQLEVLAFYSHRKDTKRKKECKTIVEYFKRAFSNLSSFSARKWRDEWRASGPGTVRTKGHILYSAFKPNFH